MRNRPRRPSPRHARASRRLLAAALLCACLALTACDAVERLAATQPDAAQTGGPNLALLQPAAYDDPEAALTGEADADAGYMPVDLWLDATQTMGGINTNEESMYPHAGKKYREGGFHYHYGAYAGWYESLLRDLLTAAGGTRVRTLRYGNETLPDAVLASLNLPAGDEAGADSVFRDLHTVAVNTNAALFTQMSGEEMAGSFYDLGSTAWLTRVSGFGAEALENPTLYERLVAAQQMQADGLSTGDSRFVLQPGADEANCALYTALDHIDTGRLSILTVDPAAIRRMSGTDAEGKPVNWYESILREKGVFDKSLCVGVLDFQLDYLGQIASIYTAALSEPLVWGRVMVDEKKQTFDYLGVMPRRLMTLVIGTRPLVDGFLLRLEEAIAADRSLRGLRGPRNGELTYAANGQTVTQQPFAFAWSATVIARPGMGFYSQHTEGTALTATASENAATALENDATIAATALENDATPSGDADGPAAASGGTSSSASVSQADPSEQGNEPSPTVVVGQTATVVDTEPGSDLSAAEGADTAAPATGAGEPADAGTADAGTADAASATTVAPTASAGAAAMTITAATSASGLSLLTLPSGADGTRPDYILAVRFPAAQASDGAALDVSTLTGAKVETVYSLLLTDILPNTPENAALEIRGVQTIRYRDQIYCFSDGAQAGAFTLTGVTLEDGVLACAVAVDGSRLLPGYYRLRISADVTGEQVAWESVPWIDGPDSVSATVSDADAYLWEAFTAAAATYDRDTKGLPKMFQHAWGGSTDKLYHGLRVPDCPPVYRSIHLQELAGQIRSAAASDTSPLIRYAFEVFVEYP